MAAPGKYDQPFRRSGCLASSWHKRVSPSAADGGSRAVEPEPGDVAELGRGARGGRHWPQPRATANGVRRGPQFRQRVVDMERANVILETLAALSLRRSSPPTRDRV